MKKSRMITWLTVMLYLVSMLGMAAIAEEGEEWFEDPSPAAETVAAAPSAPAPQPEPEKQPAQANADPEPAGSSASTGHDPQSDAAPSADHESKPEGEPSQMPAGEENEPEFWLDPSASPDQAEGLDSKGNAQAYKVLFVNPNGRILLSYNELAGTPVEDPEITPTLKGLAFSHWYQVGTNPNTPYDFGAPLEGHLTLAAFFKKAAKPEANVADPSSEEADAAADLDETDPDEMDPESPVSDEEETEAENPDETFAEDQADLPPILVKITSDADETLRFGDKVTLFANVTDQLKGQTFTVWRYNAGNGWVLAETDTLSHSFVLDGNNCSWTWEFVITVIVDGAA